MKTLWLLRHGDATPKEMIGGTDKARPLSEAGLEQAAKQADWLQAQNMVLDKVLISAATRTQETAKICLAGLNLNPDQIDIQEPLYNAGIDTLTDVIKEQDDGINTLLICGHNPSLSVLASLMGEPGYVDIQPAMLCKLELSIDQWSELKNRSGKVILVKEA